MSKIDDRARPAGAPGDDPLRGLRQRLARLRRRMQDRLWAADEAWAQRCGYDTWRSPSGWSVSVRDPRFDYRHECADCDGTGYHRITGDECPGCDGTGVVTEIPPEGGELR